MFNPGFEILLFNSFLNHSSPAYIRSRFPLSWADPAPACGSGGPKWAVS